MTITFKNVGQGDSVILSWQDNGKEKIGIIDCRKVANQNPIINHLNELDWKKTEIEFLFLSHPHYDHFSGIFNLLEFCEANHLTIKKFGHSFHLHPAYPYFEELLDWVNLDNNRTSQLKDMVEKVIKLEKDNLIKKIVGLAENVKFTLNSEYTFHCLRPSDKDKRNFASNVNIYRKQNDFINASNQANLLSTIFQLESNEHFVLFTSDATLEVLDNILIHDMDEYFKNKKMILAQVPHHGSKYNHQPVFWSSVVHSINIPMVISAGSHQKYNHPHEDVIKDFIQKYKLYATNHVNGITTYLSQREKDKSNKLNMISEIHEIFGQEGDQSFKLKFGAALYNKS